MASQVSKTLGKYESLGKIKTKAGIPFIWTWHKDPSTAIVEIATDYVKSQRKKLNETVESNFELGENFQKYEFHMIPKYASFIDEGETTYRLPVTVSTLYVKEKSIIYFNTEYRLEIRNGKFLSGEVRLFGGRENDMEEIYFNKINSVKTLHTEEDIIRLTGGFFGFFQKKETRVEAKDGIVIRGGENLSLYAEKTQSIELRDAIKQINEKIAEANNA